MQAEPMEFTCNICRCRNRSLREELPRETPSCRGCKSSVRARSLMYVLSMELFGVPLALPDFPRVKSLRGVGLSDSCYDERLAKKLDYTNTFFHREPKLDITEPGALHAGMYHFLISSEVFEHVRPPAINSFRNAYNLLKPAGLLLMTVPYSPEGHTIEHFPEMHDYGLARLRDRTVLVNRTAAGDLQVFDNLCFHGGDGSTLEARIYSESDLRQLIMEAGFNSLRIYGENYEPFGIVHQEAWSLPMAARKGVFTGDSAAMFEVMEQWSALRVKSRRWRAEAVRMKQETKDLDAKARAHIQALEDESRQRLEWGESLNTQLKERTEWAAHLDEELELRDREIERLQAENEERRRWAENANAEVDRLRELMNRRLSRRIARKMGLV